jgi:hypothetical protein
MSVYFQFPQSPEKSLYFRVLAPRRRIGDNQRRQTPGCGARTAAGSLEAVFDPSDVEHCSGIGAASGRRKSEEPPLLLPIMRQIPGEHDEPCGRQLDGLLADKNRANDFRREIRETHEPRPISQFCWRSCSPPATARIYPRYSFRCQQNGLNCRGPLHDLSIRVTYAQQPALPTPAGLWRTACPKVCSAHQCGPSSRSAAKPIANASIARPAGNARDHVAN